MESAFSTLGFVIFSLWISINAIVVESNGGHVGSELSSFASPPLPSPSRPSTRHLPRSALPPKSSSPQKKRPKSPPSSDELKDMHKRSPPPPLRRPPLRRPQPPAFPLQPPPPGLLSSDQTSNLDAPETKQHSHSHSHQMNAGKALGLFFLGMASFMQIVVVVFLVFKRRQLLKTKDIYETGS